MTGNIIIVGLVVGAFFAGWFAAKHRIMKKMMEAFERDMDNYRLQLLSLLKKIEKGLNK